MDLNVRIDKDLPAVVSGAISFETGAAKSELGGLVYEHHGAEFSPLDKGSLVSFYEDLLLGRPMPTEFATPKIQDIDTLVAIALFLHRDLATHPATPAFIHTVDFVHRLGIPALAHIEDSLARFLSALRAYFPDQGLGQRELSKRVQTGVHWIREHIHEGTIPLTGPRPDVSVRVTDTGTNGFVLAEGHGPLLDGWVELYRLGHLRGLLVSPPQNDRRRVLASKKSGYLSLDLDAACRIFNQMETAMGEPPGWSATGLWLESPKEGTLILVSHLTEVLVRV